MKTKTKTAFDCLRPEDKRALLAQGYKPPARTVHNDFMKVGRPKPQPSEFSAEPLVAPALNFAVPNYEGQGEVKSQSDDDGMLVSPVMSFDAPVKQKSNKQKTQSDDEPFVLPTETMVFSRTG